MRLTIATLGLAVGLLGSVSASVAQTPAEIEQRKFQGTWVLVAGELDGQSLPEEHTRRSKLTYEGSRVTIETPHQSRETIVATIVRLEPMKTPREMHWLRATEPARGTTMIAIYEFRGDDQYRVCYHPAGQQPPTDLVSKQGTGHICHTWARVKP